MVFGSTAPDLPSGAPSANSSIPMPADAPDDTVTPVGIVVGSVLGSALFFSCCAILFFKLRAIQRLRKKTQDQEALISKSKKPPTDMRPMSYMVFAEKDISDEEYVSQSTSPASSRPQSQESVYSVVSLPSTAGTSPFITDGERSLTPELIVPRKSVRFSGEGYTLQKPPRPARRSLLKQALSSSQSNERRASFPYSTSDPSARSPPAPTSRYALPRTPAPAPQLPVNITPQPPSPASSRIHYTPSPPRSSPSRGRISPFPTTPSPPRSPSAALPASRSPHASFSKDLPIPAKPNRLHLPNRPGQNRPRKPSVGQQHRSLSPDSSAAYLLNHPATMGRRLSDVSPGTDPEYPYPMTPQQIGDGRPLTLLGRGDERLGDSRRGRDMRQEGGSFREGGVS
ncbi:hypothetical protein MMC30_006817 [Trapelia coarctata]|nr:hypothetical protein [Trapelia coarctata]